MTRRETVVSESESMKEYDFEKNIVCDNVCIKLIVY